MDKARLLFRHPQVGHFFQEQPKLKNPFLSDGFFRRILARLLPEQAYPVVHEDLTRLGDRICSELEELSNQCEQNPPYLVQIDPWGKRLDDIVTCEAWKRMKTISAEEGFVSIAYDQKYSDWARLYQMAKLYVYSPSSGLYTCPLAMTDGAAKTILNDQVKDLDFAFDRLTTRDPSKFWTSGQWMTERRGGSDVAGGTETIAIAQPNGTYKLYGYKWFSSATDSDMSLTLARIADNQGQTSEGSGGLSMFFLRTRNEENGSLNNIQVMRLKNKLGTRQLPTAELLLDGTEALLVSSPGRGVASISSMLTITRIHNAISSVAGMRRCLNLARDYSTRRKCFGLEISKYPLHINTLASLELITRGCTVFLFEVVRLLNKVESCEGSLEEEHLLRLFTPILKLYTAKKCVECMSEGLECFGGQGYMEDTGLPKMLRDAQVGPIWEGTTNILAMDVIRAIGKSKGEVVTAFGASMKNRLQHAKRMKKNLSKWCDFVENQVDDLVGTLKEKMYLFTGVLVHIRQACEMLRLNSNRLEASSARIVSFAVAEIVIGTLLLEHGADDIATESDIVTAMRWAEKMGSVADKFKFVERENNEDSLKMVFDSYEDYEYK